MPITQKCKGTFDISLDHGRPQGGAKGALAPPLKRNFF